MALSASVRPQGQFRAVQSLVFPDIQPLRIYLRPVQETALISTQVFLNQDSTMQAAHLFTAVLAHTKLEVLKLQFGIGHFCLKTLLYYTVSLKTMY